MIKIVLFMINPSRSKNEVLGTGIVLYKLEICVFASKYKASPAVPKALLGDLCTCL